MLSMAKVIGQHATVTFDILSQDPELEQLLEEVVSSTLKPLADEDKNHLRQRLTGYVQTERRGAKQSPAVKHRKENVEPPVLIPLGGKWAYSVSMVVDEGGDKAVRIAKGPVVGAYYRDKATNQMQLHPNDSMNPIRLVSKINIKTLSEWHNLQVPVTARLEAIEGARGTESND